MYTTRLKKLLRDLNHDDPANRRAAAESLSEGDERAVYPLIKALRDDNFGVQDAAMHSLMEIKGESTAYMLLPLLREDAFLRNTALIILKEIGKVVVPLLFAQLNDKDDDVRKFALDLIHDIKYCNCPEKLVEILSGDPNANVRAAAAKALGSLQYKKAIPQLVNALKDEEWVCFSSLEALTNLRDESSIDSIVTLLNIPLESIRFAAIEALGKISSPRATQPLIKHILKTDGLEKKITITSLIRIGDIPSIAGIAGIADTLIDMLMDDDWEDKFIAIRGLVAIKGKKAIYHMIDLAGSLDLSEPESDDRLLVIIQAIHSFGCVNSLIDILNDPSIKYRGKVVAIDVIGDLKCKKAVSSLINLIKSEYRDIRRSTIKSLGQIADAEAKKCLMEAISDHDSHVRKTAVAALGKIGEMSAFKPLMAMLHKEQYDDIIDEFINSLLHINSTLFLSRIKEFNDNIQKIAARRTADFNVGVTC